MMSTQQTAAQGTTTATPPSDRNPLLPTTAVPVLQPGPRHRGGSSAQAPVGRAVVVIPALEPGPELIELVRALRAEQIDVVVVDDGSGPAYEGVFDICWMVGSVVHHLPENRGKGFALRQAFALVQIWFPGHGVVTADADGQHTLADIHAVRNLLDGVGTDGADDRSTPAHALPEPSSQIVLGVRSFAGTEEYPVPLRSRLGNAVSAGVFRLVTGVRLGDTQTGLRGLPAQHLAWAAALPGDRYEYEYTMLVRAAREGIGLRQLPIETVYVDENATSHFRPVRDSLRVLGPVAAFSGSGLLAFGMDTGLFLLGSHLGLAVWPALALARMVSSSMNFAVNRWAVFGSKDTVPLKRSAARYLTLALLVLIGGAALVQAGAALGMPLLVAKVIADSVMFCLSYVVQRLVVFRRR